MEGEGFLRVFVDMAKKAQEDRDSQKIRELQEELLAMRQKHEQLEREYTIMKEHYETEIKELRVRSIRL